MQAHRSRIQLKVANSQQLAELGAFIRTHAEGGASPADISTARLASLIEDRTLLCAWQSGRLVGVAAICLDTGQVLGPLVAKEQRHEGIGTRLIEACERLAATFQIYELEALAGTSPTAFLSRFGYGDDRAAKSISGASTPRTTATWGRRFARRKTRFGRRIEELGRALGIPEDYGRRFRLPLQPEARRLVDAGTDVFSRTQRLTPSAASAWIRMQEAAERDQVRLDLVSAYRSVDYQADLLRKKIHQNVPMHEILAVSAAPGFSEHHSGNALDLTTPGVPVLEEEFAGTEAFLWLQRHGADHGFRLSFPAGNRHGVLFEPWHWCYSPGLARAQAAPEGPGQAISG